jgi:hypothetical protein
MGSVTKAAVIGAIRGTKEVGGETLETIEETAGGAVQTASEVGADVITAAVGAVEGASRRQRMSASPSRKRPPQLPLGRSRRPGTLARRRLAVSAGQSKEQ